jgi:hypothetical protein
MKPGEIQNALKRITYEFILFYKFRREEDLI